MKLTFVTPQVGRKEKNKYVRTWQMEPLTIATLAGLTPNHVEVSYVDERLGESVDFTTQIDLLVITVETYTAKRAYEICNEARRHSVKTLLGGYHVSLIPEEAALFADSIVTGFTETLWLQVLKDAEEKKLKPVYTQDLSLSYDFAFPKRTLFGARDYFPLHCVETGRGCPLKCEFCSITAVTKATYLPRKIESVVDDIRSLKNRNVFFVEDNFVGNKRHAKALLRAVIPLKIKWVGQGTLNMADDEELLELMEASGCAGVLIGFESLKAETLKAMNKPVNIRSNNYQTLIKKLHKYKLGLYGTFIFGYENEGKKEIRETVDKAIDFGIFMAAFNHLLPFPGTPLYRRLEQEKRLVYDKWWLSSKFRFGEVPFNPASIRREDLHEECLRAREKFYSYSNTFKRGWNGKEANLSSFSKAGAFLWINHLLRREVNEKNGLPLGNLPEEVIPQKGGLNSTHEKASFSTA